MMSAQVCFPFKGLALQLFWESIRCPSECGHLALNRCAIASRDKDFVSTFYVHLDSSVEGNHRALWRSQRTGPAIRLPGHVLDGGGNDSDDFELYKRRIELKLNERIWTVHLMVIVSNIFQAHDM